MTTYSYKPKKCPKCKRYSLDYDPIIKKWVCAWVNCSYVQDTGKETVQIDPFECAEKISDILWNVVLVKKGGYSRIDIKQTILDVISPLPKRDQTHMKNHIVTKNNKEENDT